MLPFAFQVIKFNHAQAPTGDVNFRRAVQAALDMEEIMAIAYPDIYQMDGGLALPEGAPSTWRPGPRRYNKADLAAAKAHAREVELQGREADLHHRQHPPERRHRDGACSSG